MSLSRAVLLCWWLGVIVLLTACGSDDESDNTAPAPTAPALRILEGFSGTSQIRVNDRETNQDHDFRITTPAAHGRATVDAQGVVTYTPDTDFAGRDQVTVTVTDDGTPPLSGTVTLVVTVLAQKFPLGVASGDVTSSSAVLWTRANQNGTLALEVSTDADFLGPLTLTQTVNVAAATDFTVQTVAAPLESDTTYFYRWRLGTRDSVTGTFRTAPTASAPIPIRFAYSGDADGTLVDGVPAFNAFDLLDAVRREQPDFFVYLGDTVYADSRLRLGGAPAVALDEYRATYQAARTITALPMLLEATSVYAIWDDHEVFDDYAGTTVDMSRYANGRQAFLEYMPLATHTLPADSQCAEAPLFRTFRWGEAVNVIVVDERSCRSASAAEACEADPAPTLPSFLRLGVGLSPSPPAGCLEALRSPARTMLGSVQKARLKEALLNSDARFTFVINAVPIQQLWVLPYDRWEGYAAEREELLHFVRDHDIDNVIFLTTDLHATLFNEVFIDRFEDAAPVAYEVVTGPIAHPTLQQDLLESAGSEALDDFQFLLTLLQVECRHLDTFAYGLVEVDAVAGTATIAVKDDSGTMVRDQLQPERQCHKTFER
jgi:phosphodiesterase/alkaline phosphatase D-like protein